MYNIDYKELGKHIRAERRKQDLTQEKLAEMANISDSFMGHIERGSRTLSIETLTKLANALNLSIEYIICGEFNYHPDMWCVIKTYCFIQTLRTTMAFLYTYTRK